MSLVLRVVAMVALVGAAVAVLLLPASSPTAEVDALGPSARLNVELAAGSGQPSADWLRVPDIGSYRGRLSLEQSAGRVAVVNDVPLQDYVRGISEMPGNWPRAALEAQAIAARTYGLWHVLVHTDHPAAPGTDAEICATDSCQVYRGASSDHGPSRVAWAAAVAATADQVLLYRGHVIEALYSASDGGRTISGSVPWLPSVADPDDAISPLHHWTWTAPVDSFAPVFGVPSGALTAVWTTPSAVMATVRQPGPSPAQRSMSPDDFHLAVNRQLPAPAGLPLALPGPEYSMTTDSSSRTVQVEGWGFGHGLGLSQYGALGKALRGLSASAILAAYYGPARAVRLPPSQLPTEVRVLVDAGRAAVTVVGSGPLRVLDDQGQVLVAPTGALAVEERPGGLRARVIARPPLAEESQPAAVPGPRPWSGQVPVRPSGEEMPPDPSPVGPMPSSAPGTGRTPEPSRSGVPDPVTTRQARRPLVISAARRTMTSSTIVAVVALAGVVGVGAALPLVRRIVRRRTAPGP
jgi:SpoIID/LytB domain protein